MNLSGVFNVGRVGSNICSERRASRGPFRRIACCSRNIGENLEDCTLSTLNAVIEFFGHKVVSASYQWICVRESWSNIS